MIQHLLRYPHICIALRRAPRIILIRRLFPVVEPAPLVVPRDIVVDYKANVESLNAAVRERTLRLMST